MKALQARLHSPSSTRLHRLENAMNLQKFPRHPLTFGPRPSRPLPRLSAHLGGKVHLYAKREDCNSGLAFWRQQDAQARIPDPRSHCGRLRHAGVDWRHPVQPDAPGGRRGGAPGHEVRAGAGELGELPDAVYDRVGNIEMSRIMGADVRLDAAGFDIGIRPSWEQAMDDVKRRAASPSRFPQVAPSTHTAVWALWALPRKCASRKRAGLPVRLHRRVLGHGQHAGGHGGGLCSRWPRAQGDWH